MSLLGLLVASLALVVVAFIVGRATITRAVNMRDAIAIAVVLGFLAALATLFKQPIPKDNEQLIVYMLGQLSGFASGIVSYHYGQKAGDAELEAKRVDNSGKVLDVAKHAAAAAAAASGKPDVELEPGETARATGA